MPAPTPDGKTPRTFKINRFQIGLNVLLQIVLAIFIFGMVNYLAFNHFKRWDFTRDQQNALADQSKKVIGQLNDKLKMIVLIPETVPVFGDIKTLITNYQIEAKAQGKKIDVETVSPYQNLNRAKELQQKYKFGAQEALVILDYQGRTKFVNVTDMVVMSDAPDMMSQPELKGFKGEQAITQGLLEVIETKQSKLYFITGLGGPDVVNGGANQTIAEYLKRQNFALAPLTLLNVNSIPEDASTVFLIAPKYDPTEGAMKLLRDYWSKKGRLFVMLDPNSDTPKLTAWLADAGLRLVNDRVTKTENLGGGLMGVYKQVVADFKPGHPVTREMNGLQTIFDGPTQSIEINAVNPAAAKVTPLIDASEGFWGETDYNAPEDQPLRLDPGVDHAAPLILAAAVEQGAVNDERVKVDSARMICVANGDFLSDRTISSPNVDFALAAVNWLTNREQLISIAPKQKESFRLGLRDEQLKQVSWSVLIIIPAIIAIVGTGVCLARRR